MTDQASTGPLTQGEHTLDVAGLTLRYHVHGTGPVVVGHPGGPGIHWEYLRSPELEQRLTMVYLEPAGTGGSGRLPSHPDGYTRALYSEHLAALIDHLGTRVHLLGHSHGGFVAQYHAIHRPDQLAGVILYESAPETGAEFGAEAGLKVGEFAERHAGNPMLPGVLQTFGAISQIAGDADMVRVARGILPAYIASFLDDPAKWADLQNSIQATYISGRDADGTPDAVDDRAALATLRVPTLVVVGRYDVICGVRWAEELHELIPGSQLVVLEKSGHLGHLEEPKLFAESVAAFVAETKAGV